MPLNAEGQILQENNDFPIVNSAFQTTPDPTLLQSKYISLTRKHKQVIFYQFHNFVSELRNYSQVLVRKGETVYVNKFKEKVKNDI